jgi:hypothetical protein
MMAMLHAKNGIAVSKLKTSKLKRVLKQIWISVAQHDFNFVLSLKQH